LFIFFFCCFFFFFYRSKEPSSSSFKFPHSPSDFSDAAPRVSRFGSTISSFPAHSSLPIVIFEAMPPFCPYVTVHNTTSLSSLHALYVVPFSMTSTRRNEILYLDVAACGVVFSLFIFRLTLPPPNSPSSLT